MLTGLPVEPIVRGLRRQITWDLGDLHVTNEDFSDDDSESVLTTDSDQDVEAVTGGLMTESKDLCLSIDQSVTSLLRLSIHIHKASKRAKFARSSTAEHYEIGPDKSHVRDLFPYAADNDALVEKLAKANAQRRQWLWYRRRHREKLSVDFSGQAEERIRWALPRASSDIGSLARVSTGDRLSATAPSLSVTRASTLRSRVPIMGDSASLSNYPETQFGRSSRAVGEEARVLAPAPPSDLLANQPFTCRYCRNIIEISGKSAWQ